MEDKKIRKINIIDILILIFVLLILAFGIKKIKSSRIVNYTSVGTFTMKFYVEEINNFVSNNIEINDLVTDDTKNVNLGKVTNLKIEDSIDFNPNSEGKLVVSSKEGYSSLEITTELKAQKYDHGILVNGNRYSVGQSLTIRAGKTIIFLRISKIEEKDSINGNKNKDMKINMNIKNTNNIINKKEEEINVY